MKSLLSPAVFIDRDGVIIENRADYVKSWDEVTFYPKSLSALASIRARPYKIVIVTNQAGIAKGLIPLDVAETINRQLTGIIEAQGGRVDAIYMCPHRFEDGCACRKPKPGLLLQASSELGIDLSQSIMIGDALSDLQAGKAAGVAHNILVLTGRGKDQVLLPQAEELKPFQVCADLEEAFSKVFSVDRS